MNTIEKSASSLSVEQERERLVSYFSKRYPGEEIQLENYRRAVSGFSNETRFVTLSRRSGQESSSQELVLRWAPTGGGGQFDTYDIAFQYNALKGLAEAGIPVPATIFLEEDSSILGGHFFAMAKVNGDTTSDYPPGYHGAGYLYDATPAQREHAWWRSLEVMVAVNRVDWRAPSFDFMPRPTDGADAIRQRLALYRRTAASAADSPIPLLNEAFEWLEQHVPSHSALALCWSDGRPGNIIFQNYEPVAALDWEGLYIGVPESDLAWFIVVDEMAYLAHGRQRMAGLPDEAATIQRYGQLLGRSLESLDYHFLLQTAWMAVLMANSVKAAQSKGLTGFPEDYATNNPATHRLAYRFAQVR